MTHLNWMGVVLVLPLFTLLVTFSLPAAAASVQTWKQTASYPLGIAQGDCVTSSNFIYCIGGEYPSSIGSAIPVDSVYYAQLSSTGGIVGGWQQTTSYPTTIWNHSCVSKAGYIYCIGGQITSDIFTVVSTVYYAQVSSTGGIVGGWLQTTSFPTPIDAQRCKVSTTFVYCVGGANPYSTTSVYYAKLSSSGIAPGGWHQTTSYPSNTMLIETDCVTVKINRQSYIYCIAGTEGNSVSSLVYYAPLSSNGGIKGGGAWLATNGYPFATFIRDGCVVNQAKVYCAGGASANGPANDTYSARLSATGTGIWVSTPTYPVATGLQSCVAYASYMYCVGGITCSNPQECTGVLDTVYYRQL